jgi:hypothetical protein
MSETYGEKLSFDENASYWRCFSAKQTFEVNNGQNIYIPGWMSSNLEPPTG